MRKLIHPLILCCILGVALTVSSVFSQEAHIRVAPPRARHEVRTERPSQGAVWQSGYHEHDPATNAYTWRSGRWDANPPHANARWVAPRYTRRHGEYIFTPGRYR